MFFPAGKQRTVHLHLHTASPLSTYPAWSEFLELTNYNKEEKGSTRISSTCTVDQIDPCTWQKSENTKERKVGAVPSGGEVL